MVPLAHKIRPKILNEFFGQKHLIDPGKPLYEAIQRDQVKSIVFYGPPGCGKTTLAEIIAEKTNANFHKVNAVDSGIKDMKSIIDKAEQSGLFQKKTILFIDEIHRFNKKQQDFLLPYVENGTIILIGATTENPSFSITSALLSRTEVYKLEMLSDGDIEEILKRAIKAAKIKNTYPENAIKFIAILSQGDARFALNALEKIEQYYPTADKKLSPKRIQEILQTKSIIYDKDGEEHYNLISALHKSMRDSDEQAAIYYVMRMIEAGEDPLYIVRRMVRFASEDIGIVDPQALQLAIATKQTVEFLGMPESNTAIIELAVYLCRAKKSNACYRAATKAQHIIRETGALPVPLHIRNAVSKLMKEWGYGKGYKYAHDYENVEVNQKHLPEKLEGTKFYE